MFRAFFVALLVLVPALTTPDVAFADKTKKLTAAEKDHFYALRAYMNEDQRKAFLKGKTEEARNEMLKKWGLWDRFYSYSEPMRGDILKGDVKVGWDEGAVFLAWGKPYKKLGIAGRNAEMSEELRYRFEVDPYGDVILWVPDSKTEHKASMLYEVQVTVDDGRVARLVRSDCVPNWNFCNQIKWQKGD
jgi:hypothetical protein